MSKIYKNQSNCRITLTAGVSIFGAITTSIKYRKPNGTEGSFDATVSDETTGVIYYDFTDDELDASGVWTFWSYVVFADGRDAPGEPVRIKVWEEGT